MITKITNNVYFWFCVAVLLSIATPNPAIGLSLGAFLALTVGNPLSAQTGKASKHLLQFAVILLGFGTQFGVVMKVGFASIWITMISISAVFIIGHFLGKLFKVEGDLSLLLSTGTAICGGSAIAAMSPAIGASQLDTAVSMAVIFLLNGVALILFPPLGHFFGLTQEQFGFWAALAIHDTSSVVGAGAIYGAQALAIATTVKLTRALWILPVSFVGTKIKNSKSNATFPWFLLGFLAAAAIRTSIPAIEDFCKLGAVSGKHMMTGTLFLVGAGLGMDKLKKIGIKPLLMAFVLWIIVSTLTLISVKLGFMPQIGNII
ncbi:MAG: putative sulfate exporter family transporter [Synergistaceae bacterium]